MLGLPWTAFGPGAALEQFCAQPWGRPLPGLPPAPRPLRGRMAFSYASLHSYTERYIASQGGIQNLDTPTKIALARNFQTAAIAQLEEKLFLGFEWCAKNKIELRDVVVSGGVASNSYLRQWFVSSSDVPDISAHSLAYHTAWHSV